MDELHSLKEKSREFEHNNLHVRVNYAKYHVVTRCIRIPYTSIISVRIQGGAFLFRTKTPGLSELERGTWTYCHVPYNDKVYVKVNKTKNSFDSVLCLEASHLFTCSVYFKQGAAAFTFIQAVSIWFVTVARFHLATFITKVLIYSSPLQCLWKAG